MSLFSRIKKLIKDQKRLTDLDNRGWGLWFDSFRTGCQKKHERQKRIFNFVRGKK